ncbi:MAG TPA: aminoglycoside phosphotransferase family protein [Acidimicrobiales bacterium]|nr:aminoglycoside phosphotransferase family protein [Acidimicrobiales bacterium]
MRRLMGGISSSVHAVSLAHLDGRSSTVVLRRWVGDWIESEPAMAQDFILAEQRALEAAERAGVPAPRCIAADPTGADTGGPASLLMTKVPGRVDLAPRDVELWLRAQAELLPHIHDIDADVPRSNLKPDFSEWSAPASGRPNVWNAALAAVRSPAPVAPPVFRHGDFQHFNMLWSRNVLTGVVDWTFPRIGSADLDVGHCHLNLAVLYSAERAEQFRTLYEAIAGRHVDPWWNLVALLRYSDGWQTFIPVQVNGQIPVDTKSMTSRVEDLVVVTLRRLG